jgi:uncharacterized membrane protein (UPF0136 family)
MDFWSEDAGTAVAARLPRRYHRRWDWAEWLIGGGLIGGMAGFASGLSCRDGEMGAIVALFNSPLLCVFGAIGGMVGKKWGWAKIRPLAWATLFGALFGAFNPLAWPIGGAVGGIINGVLKRSVAGTLWGALLGALIGAAEFGLTFGFMIAVCTLLNS